MKKYNKIISVLLILTIILIFVVVLIYARRSENARQFHHNRANMGRILYDNIMDMDEDHNYPQTPEEVMEKKANILMLMYGDFIVDELLFEDIIIQQRLLFGEGILQLNTFEEQYDSFIFFLEILREEDIRAVNIEVLPIIYRPNMENIAVARVRQSLRNLGEINWVYYLERSTIDNKWKIISWHLADQNFNRVA